MDIGGKTGHSGNSLNVAGKGGWRPYKATLGGGGGGPLDITLREAALFGGGSL